MSTALATEKITMLHFFGKKKKKKIEYRDKFLICNVFFFTHSQRSGLSDCGNGMYFFIKDADEISSSFADCLGGLASVLAQNLTVTITTDKLEKILDVRAQDKESNVMTLPDLQMDEKKNVLFLVGLEPVRKKIK